MFSLIITIISIALVAALALATLYYGGGAFNEGRADAQAAKILIQGQQIQAAADLYFVQHGVWPTFAQMLSQGYLTSIPVAQGEALSNAVAVDQPWAQVVPNTPVYTLVDVELDTCRKVNQRAYKLDGILPRVLTAYSAQCYGTGPADLKVVVSKNGTYLLEAAAGDTPLLPVVDVSTDPLPLPTDDTEWAVAPGAPASGGGSGGGTAPEPIWVEVEEPGPLLSASDLEGPRPDWYDSRLVTIQATAPITSVTLSQSDGGFSADTSACIGATSCSFVVSFSPYNDPQTGYASGTTETATFTFTSGTDSVELDLEGYIGYYI